MKGLAYAGTQTCHSFIYRANAQRMHYINVVNSSFRSGDFSENEGEMNT